MDYGFAVVDFNNGVPQIQRPIKELVLLFFHKFKTETHTSGRTEELNERNRHYAQKNREKRKAERVKGHPEAEKLDLRSSEGRKFKEKNGIPPARVKKKPKTIHTSELGGDATIMSSTSERRGDQPLQFHHFEPFSAPPIPPPFDALIEQSSSVTNARWPSPSTLADPPSTMVMSHHGSSPLNHPSSPHHSPLPLIHSPRPAIPLAPFIPHLLSPVPGTPSSIPLSPSPIIRPPSPIHYTPSSIPLSHSPIAPLTPSMTNTREDSPLSELSSLPSTPVSADVEPDAGGLPVVDPDTTDFAAAVIGIELSPETPSLEWPTGFKTAVPFIPDPKNPKINLLALVRASATY